MIHEFIIPTCPLPDNNFTHQIKIIERVLHREKFNFRIPKDLLKSFGATLTHRYRAFFGWVRIHKDSKKGGDNHAE